MKEVNIPWGNWYLLGTMNLCFPDEWDVSLCEMKHRDALTLILAIVASEGPGYYVLFGPGMRLFTLMMIIICQWKLNMFRHTFFLRE